MDQPRGTDDKPDTKDDVAVVSKKRKTVAVSKTTCQELDLSAQNLFCDHSGPLRSILVFLDPGLDWPTCRKVSTSWHKCILSTEKTLDGPKNKPSIWMGSVVLVNPTSPKRYKKKIKKDFKLVRRWRLQKYAGRRVTPPLHSFQNWVRTDIESRFPGHYHFPSAIAEPAIVTARVHLLCRNVYHLLEESDPDLRRPCFSYFSFAGARWCVILQDRVDNRRQDAFWSRVRRTARYKKSPMMSPSRIEDHEDNRFGITLERCSHGFDDGKGCNRSDPAPPVPNSLTCAVRYNATFTALSKPIKKMREDLSSLSVGSMDREDHGEDYEYIDKRILKFALGPPPACPHLRITLDLEFVGYGFAC
mmetsp:Transcript_12525/g.30246  ORF Transcript_12525/g.30246 Transcript_12525/m.30246 type:complete len:360 (-) Transcript_12525:3082-4161(-)|eukprot:CAMPEP_0113502628 /NCGR_PEP_ID=MMETSP0014_2-20120614/33675_1 /TAXON_ID=2857 /ORGANISM="Nitzschia sp." /LENGTH=359 /DNA_ID=CAMNT_0000397467 /DNA_START=437 /DNA_END=1516 /DNA_ORIENTATION=- /assembly_acc=CAM_ASM_000159